MGRLQRLTPALEREALAYLACSPFDNVFVSWLIETRQVERGSGTGVLWRRSDDTIGGFAYYGAQIVLYTSDDEAQAATQAFAEYARVAAHPRMIVGPRATVEHFRALTSGHFGAPALVRASQPVYALTRDTLRGGRRDAIVDRATRAELDEIVPHSALMIAGELGSDPRRSGADFAGRTGRIIDAGWWWRYRVLGRLAFMCNVGSSSPHTAQLQGVWTPPDMRGRGYATRALAAICDHLLDEHPSLCLYVNDFNTPAIALYERVGFTRVGEFASLIY